ncbi:MAG: BatA domain-containing protein, partial [Hyphomonadaceae bacterium]
MTIGPIAFAAPAALFALLALPILFWVLRATPPAPQRAAFPPLRLLLDLQTDEQSRERAPLWLVLVRALMCALMIVGFARPSLAPEATAAAGSASRTLIVIDDGWTSAPFWAEARAAALDAIAEAERANGQVFLLRTAPTRRPLDPGIAMPPGEARARITSLEPQAWRPDRADAARRLSAVSQRFSRIVWITDGLTDAGAAQLSELLLARGPVVARMPAMTARAITEAAVGADGVAIAVRRAESGPAAGAVTAETAQGRSLGSAELAFTGDIANARIELPPEIAARTARVRIVGEESAGATRLIAGGAARPVVGLVDPGGEGQPLLSDLFYVDRALQPYATLQRGSARELVEARVQAMVLPDASRLAPPDREAIDRWIARGGLLIRFAGPRLANDADDLLPVRLRPGARTMGSALSWERAQTLRAFAAESPFAGLAIPNDVAVRRQVLAEPSAETESRVWARLADGAPIVTAAPRERGLIVLFHVTAGPEWSDLPLSGLYVEMLRRTLAFAGRAEGAGDRPDATGPYIATRLIDGFGALAPAGADAEPIQANAFASARACPLAPPGLYERAGIAASIDAAAQNETLAPD